MGLLRVSGEADSGFSNEIKSSTPITSSKPQTGKRTNAIRISNSVPLAVGRKVPKYVGRKLAAERLSLYSAAISHDTRLITKWSAKSCP